MIAVFTRFVGKGREDIICGGISSVLVPHYSLSRFLWVDAIFIHLKSHARKWDFRAHASELKTSSKLCITRHHALALPRGVSLGLLVKIPR